MYLYADDEFVDKNNPQNIIDAATKRQKDKAVALCLICFAEVEGSWALAIVSQSRWCWSGIVRIQAY